MGKLRFRRVSSIGSPGTWIELNLQALLQGCLSIHNPELLSRRESWGFPRDHQQLGPLMGLCPSLFSAPLFVSVAMATWLAAWHFQTQPPPHPHWSGMGSSSHGAVLVALSW